MQDRATRAEDEVSRQREALDLCPIPVIILSETGSAVYANPAWYSMLSCDFEDVLGSSWRKFIHPDDSAEVSRLVSVTVKHDLERYQGTHKFVSRDERVIEALFRMSRISSGDYIGYCIPTKPGCAAVCMKNGGSDRTRTG